MTATPAPLKERALSAATPMQLGFVVLLVGAIVSAVTAYNQVDNRSQRNATDIAAATARLTALESREAARQVELAELRKDLSYIRERIDEALKKGGK